MHFVFSFLLWNSQCFFLQVLGSHHWEGRVKHMVREVLLSCRCICLCHYKHLQKIYFLINYVCVCKELGYTIFWIRCCSVTRDSPVLSTFVYASEISFQLYSRFFSFVSSFFPQPHSFHCRDVVSECCSVVPMWLLSRNLKTCSLDFLQIFSL